MEKNLKTLELLLKAGAVVCFVMAGISLGKAIYYKGRVDACKEMIGELNNLKKDVENKIEEKKRKKDIKCAIDKEVGELREEQKKHKENGGS